MDPNYFTCTLGQAAALKLQQPHKTIPAWLKAQTDLSTHNGDLKAVAFPQPGPRPSDPWKLTVFDFRQVSIATHYVAQTLLEAIPALRERQTVALLCPSTPDLLFTWLGLMTLGHAVLLIAPQCQPPAIASLCKTCEVKLLFHDEMYRTLAIDAAGVASADDGSTLQAVGLPVYDITPDSVGGPRGFLAVELPKVEILGSDIAYLHHTSGTSSGMPKPIPQTHQAGIGVLPFIEPHAMDNPATFTTTPLYHGGIADLLRAWTSLACIHLFPGKGVPITASNIVKCLGIAKTSPLSGRAQLLKYFSSVPYVLQMMEAEPRGLEYLQSIAIVGVGGAALPAEVGDRLVASGVNLISRFGSAECGFLLSSARRYGEDKEWSYLRIAPGAQDYIKFEHQPSTEGGEQLAELVVQKDWPHMAKRNRADGAYATSDLFAQHPDVEGAWRYHSRADSQLTLITGKKFDPAPLEAAIASAETLRDLIEDVVIFGNGKPFPGMLVFSKPGQGDQSLSQSVWSVVSTLNEGSQSHARIAEHMIVVMGKAEPKLEKSSKGTLLRGAVEKRFAQTIEDAYTQVDSADAGNGVDVPDEELTTVISKLIEDVVAKPSLTETTDLFSYGVDSLAGMQIRNKIGSLLPASQRKTLPINVVEDCGTIKALVQFVLRKRKGDLEDKDSPSADTDMEYMQQLVKEYGMFAATPSANGGSNGAKSTNDHHREVIVLTGATGALGAHILQLYRQSPRIKKIYCLVRGASAHAAYERVNKALVQRRLTSLETPASNEIEALQCKLSDGRLGLDAETYKRIASEATVVMHVAWSVNFRMKLRSFVPDNIAGVRHLIDFALACPSVPKLVFCSSVASVMAYLSTAEGRANIGAIPEKIIDDPTAATTLGYSQSKWVAEQICAHAAASTALSGKIAVVRVGQLSGDTVHGVWNAKEAWPMMLSSVRETGFLPDLPNEALDWLAVDTAATALVQAAESLATNENSTAVCHVLNENRTPTWADMLTWLRKLEKFQTVAPSEWVQKLQQLADKGSDNLALGLLDFWRTAYARAKDDDVVGAGEVAMTGGKRKRELADAGGAEGRGTDAGVTPPKTLSFDMTLTKAKLEVLRNVEPVDEAYVGKLWAWIKETM